MYVCEWATGICFVNNPMLTPVLGEVFSNLVPLRYKWSESVLYTEHIPAHPHMEKITFFSLDNKLGLVVEWTVHYCGVVCEFDCVFIKRTVIDS